MKADGSSRWTEPPAYFSSPYSGSYYYRNKPVYISWYSNTLQTFTPRLFTRYGSTWNNIVSNYSGFDYTWTALINFPVQLLSGSQIRLILPRMTQPGLLHRRYSPGHPYLSQWRWNMELWRCADVNWSGQTFLIICILIFLADGGQNWNNLGYGYSDSTGGHCTGLCSLYRHWECLVRIYDPAYPDASDQSDNVFTVFVPPVIVYSPYEGQALYNKSDVYTSWITDGISLRILNCLPTTTKLDYSGQDVDGSLGYY